MLNFIKNTLSSALGFFLALGIILVFGLILMVGSFASMSANSQKPDIKKGSVLYIPLSGVIQEYGEADPMTKMLSEMGIGEETFALNQLCEAISKAKDMDEIKGIFLEPGLTLATEPATLQELRKALVDFKKSGKFIVSYADHYTQGAYYLCSVADKMAINPSGEVVLSGLSSNPIFFKEMLEKFGVKMQVFKVGTFKSAVEPFTNTEMSEANRLQVTSYMNSIWNNFLTDISESRHIAMDKLMAYADSNTTFLPTEDFLKRGMVDTITYVEGMKKMLKQYCGIDKDKKLSTVSVSDVCDAETDEKESEDKVAVYYCAGEIFDSEESNYKQESAIIGSTVVEDMEELANDDDVKAVVLRVNSPGGSAYASEQIWNAVKELRKVKPVIVSMGGYAASGGYYISSASDYIFAEPTTLTGSIGIFGMVPDVSGLLQDKLGLKFDVVKTNKLSDFGTISRPFNEDERRLMQGYIERGYALFVDRVAQGRNKTAQEVDSIGQGRVWTGEQAIEIGLVDKLGNLEDAIKYAAKKAKLGDDYETAEYPSPKQWYENLLKDTEKNYYETKMRSTLGEYYEPFMMLKGLTDRSYIQARLPYIPNIR